MNIYKVYIKDNEEHFQIWDNKGENLIAEYHDFFPRVLCDYVYLKEEFVGLIGNLIGSAYHYMESVSNGKITEVFYPHKEIMKYSRLYMFIQDIKECWFNEGYNNEYLNSSWFDYPIANREDYTQPEINHILIEEYRMIKSYFSAIMSGEVPKDIEWERSIVTKLENVDGRMCQVLYPKHTSDIVFFLFIEMFKQNIQFKVCKRCEKIFPCFNHKGVQFCERLDVSRNETCRQIKLSRVYYPDDPEYLSAKETILDIYQNLHLPHSMYILPL